MPAQTNTGGRALDLSGDLALTDGPGGVSAGPFPAQLGTTLGVGESGEVLLELDPALPDGPWRAQLTLRSGRTEHSISATVQFPPAGEAEAVTPDRGVPWWMAALALLLVLLAGLAALRFSPAPPAGGPRGRSHLLLPFNPDEDAGITGGGVLSLLLSERPLRKERPVRDRAAEGRSWAAASTKWSSTYRGWDIACHSVISDHQRPSSSM